jgi:hypothetical protein
MTRLTLILLLGLSMLVSFSVQAGNKQWHEHTHKNSHQYKHNGGHYKLRKGHHHGCKHRSHNQYRGQVQFFTIPQIASGTRYGYSVSGKVIVYKTYTLNGRR